MRNGELLLLVSTSNACLSLFEWNGSEHIDLLLLLLLVILVVSGQRVGIRHMNHFSWNVKGAKSVSFCSS